MKKTRFFVLSVGFVFSVMMLSVRAQQGAEAASGMSIRLMSWEGAWSDLWVEDGNSYVPVNAGEFALGRPFALERKTSSLRIFRDEVVEGVNRKQPMGEVALPDGTRSVLVVLAANPAGSVFPIQGRAIDQSLEVHRLETMRVVNFSALRLALRVGGLTALVEPGSEVFFPFPTEGPPNIIVEVAVATTEGWTIVQRSMQPAPKGRRILVLVRNGRADYAIEDPELRTKPVDVIYLIDRAPPAEVKSSNP